MDESNAGMRLTTAKFYSPKGKPYSGVGVEPDVLVKNIPNRDYIVAKPIEGQLPVADDDGDAMLKMAVKIARGQNQTLQAARK